MFIKRDRPSYEKAVEILVDENSSLRRLRYASRCLSNKNNDCGQYIALCFLCALRGVWEGKRPVKDAFTVFAVNEREHPQKEKLIACASLPFVLSCFEKEAVRHDYYALSYLARAHYYGLGVAKNVKKAKELVMRARKHEVDEFYGRLNEEIFAEIENCDQS